MSDNKPTLVPPDPERCQTEISSYRPFMMGGRVHETTRCLNKPDFIVSEIEPDEDGLKGSMSMCKHCYAVFTKQCPDKKVSLEVVP